MGLTQHVVVVNLCPLGTAIVDQDGWVPTSQWLMSVGSLLLRDAREDDIEPLLAVRNDPGVNRFMLRPMSTRRPSAGSVRAS